MQIIRFLCFIFAIVAIPASAEPLGQFDARILAAHNAERTRMDIAPLVWNPQLAAQAQSWANDLAARGAFEHSRERGGAGENLWAGTSGRYAPETMIGAFVDERSNFQSGRFPEVSRTGRWQDVGHYTQLIWPATREVGCALAQGRARDILVCRYFPAGNWIGQQVP